MPHWEFPESMLLVQIKNVILSNTFTVAKTQTLKSPEMEPNFDEYVLAIIAIHPLKYNYRNAIEV